MGDLKEPPQGYGDGMSLSSSTVIDSLQSESNTLPTQHQLNQSSTSIRTTDLIGQMLGDKYRVHRLLGQGGAGAVYHATQLDLDRPVAIKVLRSDVVCDVVAIERFRREARAAAKLHHPNVVAVYDFGMLPEICAFIAMEYLTGRTLREEIRKFPTGLPVEKAVGIFDQICFGVQAAHDLSIIHRDLKPQNIFLEEFTNGQVLAKVLDFGIAKMLESSNEEHLIDLTGSMLLGTPHYCSPEQCLGETLDHRSDIYSLGIVLFQMLTGHLPFDGHSSGAILIQHVNGHPKTLREFRPSLPMALERVVLRALEKNRSDRPASARDFAMMVKAAMQDESRFLTTSINLKADVTEKTETVPLPARISDIDPPTLVQSTTAALGISTPISSGELREKLNLSSASSPRLNSTFPIDISFAKRRIAVLPLRNLARVAEIDFLSFSLADAVISQLAYVKSLIVRPSSAIERFRDQVDVDQVARALDVDTVLTGNFLKAGETFRVSVQLVDIPLNEIIWREQLDLPFGDILVLQDRIAEKIVEGLKLTISSAELERIHRDVAKNVVAYELFLKAKNYSHDVHEDQTALDLLKSSLEADPTYAPAWAELAMRHLHIALKGLGGIAHVVEARKAASRALEINPDLPEALSALMGVSAEMGDVSEAVRICYRLLEIAPNNELTYLGLGHAYEYSGLLDQALRAYTRSMQINPKLSASYTQIAAVLSQRGRYDLAYEFLTTRDCKEVMCEVKAYLLGVLSMRKGAKDEAIRQFKSAEQWSPRSLWGRLSLAMHLNLENDLEGCLNILDQIRATVTSGDSCFYLAHHYTVLNQPEIVLDLLEKAIDRGYCNVEGYEQDPAFKDFRELPRFEALVNRARDLQSQFMSCMNELQRKEVAG